MALVIAEDILKKLTDIVDNLLLEYDDTDIADSFSHLVADRAIRYERARRSKKFEELLTNEIKSYVEDIYGVRAKNMLTDANYELMGRTIREDIEKFVNETIAPSRTVCPIDKLKKMTSSVLDDNQTLKEWLSSNVDK